MKAIFEFSLPEEKHEYKCAQQGADLRIIVSNLDETLRVMLKHGHKYETATMALQDIRKRLHEDLEDYDINLND